MPRKYLKVSSQRRERMWWIGLSPRRTSQAEVEMTLAGTVSAEPLPEGKKPKSSAGQRTPKKRLRQFAQNPKRVVLLVGSLSGRSLLNGRNGSHRHPSVESEARQG